MADIYDVIIVGAGASGSFAAIELVRYTDLKVLLIEKVKRLHDTREVANGFLGGSARSDVKLFLSPGFGGEIKNPYIFSDFIDVLEEYNKSKIKISRSSLPRKMIETLKSSGMQVDEPETATVSSDVITCIDKAIFNYLSDMVDIKSNCMVNKINNENGLFSVQTGSGTYLAKKCILAAGRGGAQWIRGACDFAIPTVDNKFDLGVRLEFPYRALKQYCEKSTNFRLKFDNFRTTSVSAKGTVETENVFDIKTSNGRSIHGKSTGFSNMAILKSFNHTDALNKLLNTVQIINILADGQLLKEPVSKLMNGSSVLSHFPEFVELIPGIERLFEVFPDIASRCYLYAPEARLNSVRFETSAHMEAVVPNLYIAGDMSGQTKSFAQAACSGMLAARHIVADQTDLSDM